MKKTILAIGFLGAMIPAVGANAATLFQDDFATEVAASGTTLNFTNFVNFDVTAGSVDLISSGGYGITCETGGCVDLDGSTGAAGTMTSKTTYNFLANVVYTLTARVSANQRTGSNEYLTLGVAGFGSGTVLIPGGTGYADHSFSFTSSSAFSGQFFVGALGGDNLGPVLNSITLSDNLSSVPLPASAFLLGGALAGLGALRRRRKAA